MISLTLESRTGRATSTIDFDPDSYLITARLADLDFEGPVRTTSDLYGDLLGVPRQHGILTIGDLLLTVAPPNRLASLEWRVGPAVLRKGNLPELVGAPVTLHITAGWDDNGRADYPGATTGTFDPASRALCIQLGSDPVRWVSPADGVGVGLSGSDVIAAVYLSGLPVDLCRVVGCQ